MTTGCSHYRSIFCSEFLGHSLRVGYVNLGNDIDRHDFLQSLFGQLEQELAASGMAQRNLHRSDLAPLTPTCAIQVPIAPMPGLFFAGARNFADGPMSGSCSAAKPVIRSPRGRGRVPGVKAGLKCLYALSECVEGVGTREAYLCDGRRFCTSTGIDHPIDRFRVQP
jgi:hypothetical protein